MVAGNAVPANPDKIKYALRVLVRSVREDWELSFLYRRDNREHGESLPEVKSKIVSSYK